MFYSIDLDNLRFVHKHADFHVVNLLAMMELPHVSVTVTSFNTTGSLDDLTVFEIAKLYANTTGRQCPTSSLETVRTALYGLAQSLPCAMCDPAEVERQAALVPVRSDKIYRYVKGAAKPTIVNFDLIKGAQYSGEVKAPVYCEDAPMEFKSSKPAESKSPVSSVKPKGSTVTFVRPEDGIALEIWKLLDEQEYLRDGMAIQVEAKRRGWNTLTAILQLSQWKKFNGV